MTRLIALTAAAAIALAAPALADGKQHKNNGHNNGTGWGVGQIPPGHLKKMHRHGDRLPDGYIVIRDYDRYGLPRLRDGERYVRLNDDIYRIARDTQTVIEAIGILDRIVR